jgi:uncharacterized protein YndB with AHSA1/START domain
MSEHSHGTYETIDGRPALRFERRYPHPVEKVWRAVTEPSDLAHWFPAHVEIDLRPGGAIAYSFPFEIPDMEFSESDMRGEVLVVEEPHRFAFTWGDEELRIELEPVDDGAATALTFTNLLTQTEMAARQASGWHVCLRQLGERLDGGTPGLPGPDETDETRALFAQYAERGVPSGTPLPGS